MIKSIVLVLPLILLGCANAAELNVADQTEMWIDSWVVVKGETKEQTDARYVRLPKDAEYDPESMKVIVSHFNDERPMWAILDALWDEDDPLPEHQWPIEFILKRSVRHWLPDFETQKWIPGGMEYLRSDEALIEFIEDCEYDLKTMRTKYKADLAKEKLENKNTSELED